MSEKFHDPNQLFDLSEPADREICLGLEEECDAAATGDPCQACRAYAEALGDAPWLEVDEPLPFPAAALPSTLGRRLREMTEDFAEADPLYIRALSGEPLGDEVPPDEAENPGRRAAHDALAVTFAQARRRQAMSRGLEAKLRDIPRRHRAARLPIWLVDSRWATAASLFLTATLALLADDVSARFQQTANVLTGPAPIVEQIEVPDWPVRQAELERLIEGARQATDQHLENASEVASSEARGLIDGVEDWRRAQAKKLTESAQAQWGHFSERMAQRFDAAAKTLEDTKVGQFVADLMLEGENNE